MGLDGAFNLIKKGASRGRELGFRAALAYAVRRIHDAPKRMERAVFDAYSEEMLGRQRISTDISREIKISLLVPLYGTPIPFLEALIHSVQDQTYTNWELCFADGSEECHTEVEQCVLRYAETDRRIRYRKLERNEGISGNSNACLDLATGDYIGLLDHDDLLHPAALYEVVRTICETKADFIYTDEATFQSPEPRRIVSIHYKPDYAPDQLRANNYICHFSVFSRSLVVEGPLFRKEFDGSQDHDLILRLTSRAERVAHIPQVLYLWRSHPQSVAMDLGAKSYAAAAGVHAVEAAAFAAGYPATAEVISGCGSVYRLRYAYSTEPLVSIVIPQWQGGADAASAAEDLLTHTDYPNLELLLVGRTRRVDLPCVHYVEQEPTSFAEGCCMAAEQADGAYLLFFDAALRPESADWLSEMMMYAQRTDVGAVGVRQSAKNKLDHTGYVLGFGHDSIVGCPYRGFPTKFGGYMHCLRYARNVSAVDGSCMLLKKADYCAVGGIDPELEAGAWDLDLCLALGQHGLRQVWTPYAAMKRRTAKRVSVSDKQKHYVRQKWGSILAKGDPYYNPNFSHRWGGFLIEKK